MRLAKATETESGFQRAVIALARLHGWRVAHFRPAMNERGKWRTAVAGDGAGFPDLVLVKVVGKNKRLIFVELKTDAGRVRPEQREWLAWLSGAGVSAAIWRPADWAMIERELKG